MTLQKQQIIADSFSDKFEEFGLDLKLSEEEFKVFTNGIFSSSMDEKWNIFVLENCMYCARSWTHHCIFKVPFSRQSANVLFGKAFVTKDKTQYNSSDIEQDKILLQRLIQNYLGRDDIYIDPEFKLSLIKEAVSQNDPNNECTKSIGHNNVEITRNIYDGMTTEEQKRFYDVFGWADLKRNISTKDANEPLLSLHLQNKKNNSGVTLYFNKDGTKLLGQIEIKSKISNS